MAKIVVQLDAFVLPDDHKVYKLSPGETHRFYDVVNSSKIVFMDIRGLDQLGDRPSEWQDSDVLKIISDDRWARELISRERGNDPKGEEGVGVADRHRLGFLKRLLLEAKKGDIVVVPVDGYLKDVLIGEFLDDPNVVKLISARDADANFKYIGRRVRWRNKIPKRLMSKELVKEIHIRTAMFEIDISLHDEICRYAFKNYVFRGLYVSDFFTSKQKFTAEDSAVLSTWFNGIDVVYNAIKANETDGLIGKPFSQLGLMSLGDARSAELKISIRSPGSYVLRSTGPFALTLMTLFALNGCASKDVIDNGVIVEVKTVGSAKNTCRLEVQDSVKNVVKTLAYERLDEAIAQTKRAHDDAAVTTPARLKPAPKGRK